MLPSIREDETSELVNITCRPRSKRLKSGCKVYLDMLKRKLREIQGPKIKFPKPLLEYFESKKAMKNDCGPIGFPGLEDVLHKFKRPISSSLDKRSYINHHSKRCTPIKKQCLMYFE